MNRKDGVGAARDAHQGLKSFSIDNLGIVNTGARFGGEHFVHDALQFQRIAHTRS